MEKKIDTALNSGAIDFESWNDTKNSMFLPNVLQLLFCKTNA
jgi:hypothetical protein